MVDVHHDFAVLDEINLCMSKPINKIIIIVGNNYCYTHLPIHIHTWYLPSDWTWEMNAP